MLELVSGIQFFPPSFVTCLYQEGVSPSGLLCSINVKVLRQVGTGIDVTMLPPLRQWH